jgi:rieske iron-sulfur protein
MPSDESRKDGAGGGNPAALRRVFLGAGVSIGLLAGRGWTQSDPAHERPKEGDLLVRVDNPGAAPLKPDDIEIGAVQIMAWPVDPAAKVVRDGSRLNKVLLLRLDPAALGETTAARAAAGVLAYSAICPHTGCEVVSWVNDRQILECPCHNSQYDPKAGARVIAGPSPRGLAALPLRLTDGQLTVAHAFIGRLGIQQL